MAKEKGRKRAGLPSRYVLLVLFFNILTTGGMLPFVSVLFESRECSNEASSFLFRRNEEGHPSVSFTHYCIIIIDTLLQIQRDETRGPYHFER